jgi:hypothetical protein
MKILYIYLAISLISLLNCKDILQDNSDHEIRNRDGRIFIVDNTGKEWDVTHAANAYGKQPERFQFGLGPDAIRPIQNPKFLNPGDAGYPADNDDRLVIGSVFNGVNRAYPIDVLSSHEIVDDVFGDAHVAVAY